MREHKFKAWNTMVHRMSEPFHLSSISNRNFNSRVLIFLEYTGLKDKNRYEVCEGDIIKVKRDIADAGRDGTIMPCEWDKNLCAFRFTDGEYVQYEAGDLDNEEFEIIGNIYENPELLTEKE